MTRTPAALRGVAAQAVLGEGAGSVARQGKTVVVASQPGTVNGGLATRTAIEASGFTVTAT
jgi:hypothetical protein